MNINKHKKDVTHKMNNTKRWRNYEGITNDFISKTFLEIDGVLTVRMATLQWQSSSYEYKKGVTCVMSNTKKSKDDEAHTTNGFTW